VPSDEHFDTFAHLDTVSRSSDSKLSLGLDPVLELNNFLQEVQRPKNLTVYLHYNYELIGPNHQAIHNCTLTCQSVPYTLLDLAH
jgi:hypothetical protein